MTADSTDTAQAAVAAPVTTTTVDQASPTPDSSSTPTEGAPVTQPTGLEAPAAQTPAENITTQLQIMMSLMQRMLSTQRTVQERLATLEQKNVSEATPTSSPQQHSPTDSAEDSQPQSEAGQQNEPTDSAEDSQPQSEAEQQNDESKEEKQQPAESLIMDEQQSLRLQNHLQQQAYAPVVTLEQDPVEFSLTGQHHAQQHQDDCVGHRLAHYINRPSQSILHRQRQSI